MFRCFYLWPSLCFSDGSVERIMNLFLQMRRSLGKPNETVIRCRKLF